MRLISLLAANADSFRKTDEVPENVVYYKIDL